jgi:hypothetical protein
VQPVTSRYTDWDIPAHRRRRRSSSSSSGSSSNNSSSSNSSSSSSSSSSSANNVNEHMKLSSTRNNCISATCFDGRQMADI